MKRISTHIFNGSRYRIRDYNREKWAGRCAPPGERNKTVGIPMAGDTLEDLDTMLHEALHACFWGIGEDTVEKSAADIARFLWRLGWRR